MRYDDPQNDQYEGDLVAVRYSASRRCPDKREGIFSQNKHQTVRYVISTDGRETKKGVAIYRTFETTSSKSQPLSKEVQRALKKQGVKNFREFSTAHLEPIYVM